MQVNRGTKRRCSQCGANFYDLDRTPIICPKCHADYVAGPRPPVRGLGRAQPHRDEPVLPDEEPREAEAFAEDEVLSDETDEDDLRGEDLGGDEDDADRLRE